MDKGRVKKRAYIVSDSILSPLGLGTDENMRRVSLYQTGVTMVDDKSLFSAPFMAARITDDSSSLNISGLPDNASILERRVIAAVYNASSALSSDRREEIVAGSQLIIATTKGNIDIISGIEEEVDQRAFLGYSAKRIAGWLGMVREPIVISSACISGVNAIIEGSRIIEANLCENVVVVGADLLTRFVITGFESFKSVSSKLCRPYDISRDGLNLGEAVGVVILSSERELCRDSDPVIVEGGAITSDANHLSAPSRTGDGLGTAMIRAMEDACVSPENISFINAHGTSTIYNDEMESKALHFASLQDVAVQSLKPFFGHTLGASGVVEAIASAWQMRNSLLFGTLGFSESGVPMEIKLTPHHKELPLYRCVKSASGFGGCNAAIVMALESCSVNKYKSGASGWREIAAFKLSGDTDFDAVIREKYKELDMKDIKFFKMDGMSRLGVIGAASLLRDAEGLSEVDPFNIGFMLSNYSSSLDTDIKHQKLIDQGGDLAASPAVFVYTLPNIVIGEISIRNKFKGENLFFVNNSKREESLFDCQLQLAESSGLEIVICGWCEYFQGRYDLFFKLFKREIYGK
ncbi:MAG: beta-ketoacyl synthase N-terminal-like domain-containing protein [Bacteroidales bacterium]